uniref:Uncharacterized protein n=1 Tax=Rhizophora mucronata TaxID=61149 RepID=A0A2P2N086_RHIMU
MGVSRMNLQRSFLSREDFAIIMLRSFNSTLTAFFAQNSFN